MEELASGPEVLIPLSFHAALVTDNTLHVKLHVVEAQMGCTVKRRPGRESDEIKGIVQTASESTQKSKKLKQITRA